jgi:hypothetical protein
MTTSERWHGWFAFGILLVALVAIGVAGPRGAAGDDDFAPAPFGAAHPQLDRWVTGEWWNEPWSKPGPKAKPPQRPPFPLDVARDEVVAFALYTVSVKPAGGPAVLKLTAQLFPLKPGEPRVARLEVKRGDGSGSIERTPCGDEHKWELQ